MKYFFEAGVGSIPAFSMAETAVKASGTGARRPVDVCSAQTKADHRPVYSGILACTYSRSPQ